MASTKCFDVKVIMRQLISLSIPRSLTDSVTSHHFSKPNENPTLVSQALESRVCVYIVTGASPSR